MSHRRTGPDPRPACSSSGACLSVPTAVIDPVVIPASVSGHVWLDLNPNLAFDAAEPPFSGLVVRIYDAAGVEVASMPVDADGFYEFTDLRPGDYTIVVDGGTVDPGYVVVLDPDGVNDLVTDISLAPGERLEDRDFAYRGDAEIGDTVWRDNNRNGVQDAGEPGIAGVGAEIVWAGLDGVFGTGDDYRYPNTVTDSNGKYRFGDLPPGNYVIAVETPPGLTPTTATSFTINLDPSESYMLGDVGLVATDPDPLPKTGSDTDRLMLSGALAIAFGVMMLFGAAIIQRRREDETADNA